MVYIASNWKYLQVDGRRKVDLLYLRVLNS